ncbi:MAG: zinc ribbon domain-containing protein [Deltaproteobacteria bacterium]|nr:MAG: zinc ribbon domain-containing protein [Deltaproteobacteria bacterium]
MPIYEFYCRECHTIFNFYSGTVNTEKRPTCPRCRKIKLDRHMSVFSIPRHCREDDDQAPFPDMDETSMEKAMNLLEKEMAHVDENDPRQAAELMRKLTDMTGLRPGPGMEEALQRMAAGEDPESVEAELGDILEEEEPFSVKKQLLRVSRTLPPGTDDTLYEL